MNTASVPSEPTSNRARSSCFVVEYVVQKVAAAVEARARPARLDQSRVLVEQRHDGRDDVIAPIVRRVHGRPAGLPSHVHGIAVIEYGAKADDMIAGESVTESTRAGSVGGQHAAEGAFAAGRVRCEAPTDSRQCSGEIAIDHARLNADGLGAHFEDGSEMLAEIDDQPGPERFTGDARARAARTRGI